MLVKLLNFLVQLICPPTQDHKPPPPPPSHHKPHFQQPHIHQPQPQPHVQKPYIQQPPPQKPQQHRPPQDLNQINQSNEYYVNLRAKANEQGDKMGDCFDAAHKAYENGAGAQAKELSNQGKAHKQNMNDLNQQASDWIFAKNNEDSEHGEIDLHGLYVKEAIARTDKAIQNARSSGQSEIRLIVGKGLHSPGGSAKLRPAVEDLMRKHQLRPEVDPRNPGVLIVQIGHGRGGVGSDEITRRIDEGCNIM